MLKLSGSQVRHLRALGHALKPVVQIGKAGLTDTLLEATASALATHELIKVKVQPESPIDRHEAAEALADATSATLAQVLGRTFLLYRRHPSKRRIFFPGEEAKKEAAERGGATTSRSKASLRRGPKAKKAKREAREKAEAHEEKRAMGPRRSGATRR